MSAAEAIADTQTDDGMIVCMIDGGRCHSIRRYLKENHPDWTMERYKEEYPDAPTLSEHGRALALRVKAKKDALGAGSSRAAISSADVAQPFAYSESFFHDIFELGNSPAALSSTGNPISIRVLTEYHEEASAYLQDVDTDYVFNIDLIKKVCLGFELSMNVYLWGLHGTGKTTVLEQCAARTGRPFLRVQHTGNTEEAHILGQYVVKVDANGSSYTEFQYGPLALAMKYGMVYCADEYDFAMPSVIALYQPVLEGKALVIKDAPIDMRVIKPHPDFRFVATGNTNGVGDETGLYQGTMIQNAASYSRFHITEEVHYMPADQEVMVLRAKAGLVKADAVKFVKIANAIRERFREGGLSMTISPRELITAAKLSIVYANDPSIGLKLAFVNRCSRVDQKAINDLVQRHF